MSSDTLHSDRLFLRRPLVSDAEAIFERYASDPDVTRYLAWPTHRAVEETRVFIAFSDAEWARWPAGPFLIFDERDGRLLGGTGLGFETLHHATTGYVLARDAWGHGFATEATGLMVQLAAALGVARLTSACHADHAASRRVLEKSGFTLEGVLPKHAVFPNLSDQPQDICSYAKPLSQ